MKDLVTVQEQNTVKATNATQDEQVINMWLYGRSPKTVKEYKRNALEFLAFSGSPLRGTTVETLQEYVNSLSTLGLPSIRAKLSAVKSLFSYAHRIGYVPFNVGAVVELPKSKDTLAERILPESDVIRMIALEQNTRNKAILILLYAGGLRVSEIVNLTWNDVSYGSENIYLTVYGKGNKTRYITLARTQFEPIQGLYEGQSNAHIFRSQKGGALDQSQVNRIVKRSAKRAGIDKPVSPHWLRHAHASHSLDHGCPVHVLQSTLGHSSLTATSRYTHARPKEGSGNYLAI